MSEVQERHILGISGGRDSAALAVHIFFGNVGKKDHVRQHIKGLAEILAWDFRVITGLLLRGKGVQTPADAFHAFLQFRAGIFFCPFKDNVLQKMGRAFQLVGLKPSSDPAPEPQ